MNTAADILRELEKDTGSITVKTPGGRTILHEFNGTERTTFELNADGSVKQELPGGKDAKTYKDGFKKIVRKNYSGDTSQIADGMEVDKPRAQRTLGRASQGGRYSTEARRAAGGRSPNKRLGYEGELREGSSRLAKMTSSEILEKGFDEIRANQKIQVQQELAEATVKNQAVVDDLYTRPQNVDIERRQIIENEIKDLKNRLGIKAGFAVNPNINVGPDFDELEKLEKELKGIKNRGLTQGAMPNKLPGSFVNPDGTQSDEALRVANKEARRTGKLTDPKKVRGTPKQTSGRYINKAGETVGDIRPQGWSRANKGTVPTEETAIRAFTKGSSPVRSSVFKTLTDEINAEKYASLVRGQNPIPSRELSANELETQVGTNVSDPEDGRPSRVNPDLDGNIEKLTEEVEDLELKREDLERKLNEDVARERPELRKKLKGELAEVKANHSLISNKLSMIERIRDNESFPIDTASQMGIDPDNTPRLGETRGAVLQQDSSEMQTTGSRDPDAQLDVEDANQRATRTATESDRITGTQNNREIRIARLKRLRENLVNRMREGGPAGDKAAQQIEQIDSIVSRYGHNKTNARVMDAGDATQETNRGTSRKATQERELMEKGPTRNFQAKGGEYPNRGGQNYPNGPGIRAEDALRDYQDAADRPQHRAVQAAARKAALRNVSPEELGPPGRFGEKPFVVRDPRSKGYEDPNKATPKTSLNRLTRDEFVRSQLANPKQVADLEAREEKALRRIKGRMKDKSVIGLVERGRGKGVPSKMSGRLIAPLREYYKILLEKETLLRSMELQDQTRSQIATDRNRTRQGLKAPRPSKGESATKEMVKVLAKLGLKGRAVPLILLSLLGVAGAAALGSSGSTRNNSYAA